MENYEVRINLTLQTLDRELKTIDSKLQTLGKDIKLSGLEGSLKKIDSQLSTIASDFGAALSNSITQAVSKATGKGTGAVPKNLMAAGIGEWTSDLRANQFAQWGERINTAFAKSANYIKNAAVNAKALNTISMQSGRAFETMWTSAKKGSTILSTLSQRAKMLGANLLTALGTKALPTAIGKWNSAVTSFNNKIRSNISLLGSWWNHFGRIAIGFTIAYRAMNAFETLLSKTSETIKGAIKESGEFAALQGKLAMFTTLASKGQIGFEQAFKQSGKVVASLAQASIKSISSVEELSVAMDELAQAGVLIPPNLTKEFVSFADFTSLISQTTGDNVRQLRSEINALMEGQMRANNTLIRTMKNFGIITVDQIANLRKMHGRAEVVEIIMKKIHEVWTQFVDKAIASNPALAFAIWEKSIRRTLLTAINLVSEAQGKFNIFADTLKKHIDKWNAAFSGEMRENVAVKQMAVTMDLLNRAFDKALTAFEYVILGITQIATAFTNLDDSIKKVLKILLLWEASVIAFKGFKILGKAFAVLNAGLFTAIARFGFFPAVILGTAAAVFLANSALEAFNGQTKTSKEKVDELTQSIDNLKTAIFNLKFTLVGAFTGFKIGGIWGGLIGGGMGLAADLVNNADSTRKNISIALASLEQERTMIRDGMKKAYDAYQKAHEEGDKQAASAAWRSFENFKARNELISNRIYELTKQTEQKVATNETSFMSKWFKQTMDNLSLLVDAGFNELKPIMNQLSDWWKKVSFPHIDLTSKLTGGENPWEQISKAAEDSLKDIDKELGTLSHNIYERFIKAVNDGKVALANLFAAPAKSELQYEINDLQRKIPLLQRAIRLTEGTDDALKYKAALAGINAQIVDLTESLNSIDHMKALAPASMIANRLKDEFEYIKNTTIDGSRQQIEALMALQAKYQGAMEGIPITSEDMKQMDKINDYKKIMKELSTVTLDWKVGVQAGLEEVSKPGIFDRFRDITTKTFDSLEEGIVGFTSKGKQSFTDMINSMLNDLLRLIVRMQIIQPLAQLMNTTFFANPATPTLDQYSSATQRGLIPHAAGGWLNEKIIGIGLSSGKLHSFAEKGPEYVAPPEQMGGKTEVNIYGAPANTRVEESTSGGTKRIDIYIDEIMAGKLAGGSKSANVLRKIYGLQPALAGR